MRITRISKTKNSAKLLHGKIADIANFELGGLAHDPTTVISGWSCDAGIGGQTWVPISSSTTSILSAMTGGLGPLLRAALSISRASGWDWSEKRGH